MSFLSWILLWVLASSIVLNVQLHPPKVPEYFTSFQETARQLWGREEIINSQSIHVQRHPQILPTWACKLMQPTLQSSLAAANKACALAIPSQPLVGGPSRETLPGGHRRHTHRSSWPQVLYNQMHWNSPKWPAKGPVSRLRGPAGQ